MTSRTVGGWDGVIRLIPGRRRNRLTEEYRSVSGPGVLGFAAEASRRKNPNRKGQDVWETEKDTGKLLWHLTVANQHQIIITTEWKIRKRHSTHNRLTEKYRPASDSEILGFAAEAS